MQKGLEGSKPTATGRVLLKPLKIKPLDNRARDQSACAVGSGQPTAKRNTGGMDGQRLDETWCNGGIGGCSKKKKGFSFDWQHGTKLRETLASFRHFPSFRHLPLLICFVSFSLIIP
jgi:hypothetical protein